MFQTWWIPGGGLFLLVGCRISAKRQQWYGNEVNLWFYQKEGMSAVVVWEGTQNPLVRDRRQIQQRGPWTTASSVFIFCAAAESATKDSRRPEQLWSSVFFRRSKLQSCLLGFEETKKKKIWPGGDDKFIFFRICRISFDGPHWAVIDVVFQKPNAACICFGVNGKKTKWPHVERHYQWYDP